MAGTTSRRVAAAALVPCHAAPPALELLERVRAHLDLVLVVDDGSPDPAAVADRADEAGARLLRLPENRGKGHAVAAGLAELLSRAPAPDAVVVVDADGQHPPEAIPLFLRAAAEAELVIGDRVERARRMPLERRIANALARGVLSALTGRRVRDTQCGMRLLRGRALHAVPFPAGRYESETVHLKRCLRAGVAVAWVPIPALYAGERSSFRNVRDTLRVLRALVG